MDAAISMPGPVRTARILLWIDIALMGVTVVLLLFAAADVTGHAPQEATRLIMVILWSVVLVVLIAFLTVKLSARRRWARVGLIMVMALNILGYLVNLLANGGLAFSAILGLALAVAVIVCLVHQDARAYLDQ
ncbi:hypothetical protein OUY22_09665 [Nonomuraea sp. MCN248]|uniref:Uncharacterized protein n=1 Tax=Nonomuraea corallina TaxID=2989783 RepID=A0ABT4S937_9ACTN|nr:hypothetical protein [Nonomuraea corallina]MDA0633684.1 hypothetical protein [Nonomuraea corallina]